MDKIFPEKIHNYFELIRLNKPIGFMLSTMALLVFSSLLRFSSTIHLLKLLYTFFYWISNYEKCWLHN